MYAQRGGGGGAPKAYPLYKNYHFPYTKNIQGGEGGGGAIPKQKQ